MLSLSRKTGEDIILEVDGHDDVTIRVLRVDWHHSPRVTIGIKAPKEINIRRAELPSRRVQPKNQPNCTSPRNPTKLGS